jgi:hypothetical protein
LNNFDQIVIHENTSSNNFQEFFFLSTNIKLSIWLIKENIQFHVHLTTPQFTETIYMCILTNLTETIYMCILTNLIETISTCILANVVKKNFGRM